MLKIKFESNGNNYKSSRKIPNRKSLLNLDHAFVFPYLNYTFGANASDFHIDALLKIKKNNIRIITYSSYLAHTDEIFKELNILPVYKLILQRICLQMF